MNDPDLHQALSGSRADFPKGPLMASSHWRQLVRQIGLRPRQTVVDVGCGSGKLAVMLKQDSPETSVYGFDPDPSALDRAERRSYVAGAMVHFIHATFDDVAAKLATLKPTQVVISRVLHRLTAARKVQLLAAISEALPRGGALHIADVGCQRASLGTGHLMMMRDLGFEACNSPSLILTMTGAITLYHGVKS